MSIFFKNQLIRFLLLSVFLVSAVIYRTEEVAAIRSTDILISEASIKIGTSPETMANHLGRRNAMTVDIADGSGYAFAYYQSETVELTVGLFLYGHRTGDGGVTTTTKASGPVNFYGYGEGLDFNGYYKVDVTMFDDSVVEPEEPDEHEEYEHKHVERKAVNGIYTVVEGDYLYSIAQSFNLDFSDFLTWNKIYDANYDVNVGEELLVTEYGSFFVPGEGQESILTCVQGQNRFETAALISSDTYPSADTVVIANAMNFADALSGVPLAYQNDAPILLAHGQKLRTVILEEINRLGATNAIILGGDAAISLEIEQELKNSGLTIQRIAGDNRFETSALIAEELTTVVSSDTAVVVDGMNFADAMSIAPIAAREGMPIYLTRTNRLLNAEKLDGYAKVYLIGGENAVSSSVEKELNNPTRLSGIDRYETNREVLQYFGLLSDNLYIATGLDFADALTGSVAAAQDGSAVGLVRGSVHTELIDYFKANYFETFIILGGEIAVPNRVYNTLGNYLTIR